MRKATSFFIALLCLATAYAQSVKPGYNPCLLSDSVEPRLDFIRLNAVRIFGDTADCKQRLFDSIGANYIRTKDKKFLDVLSCLRTSSAANKVENLYTDVIRKFVQSDFSDFLLQLYNARGKYLALENELAITMNMIIDGRPYKQKYMGLMNVEISKAKDTKNSGYAAYLEKLKLKIEEDRH
jgi:hypothetical protein